jgi:hypothetical protein
MEVNKSIKNLILATSLILPAMFSFAETMVFDTVSLYRSAAYGDTSILTGTEKDTGGGLRALFRTYGDDSYSRSVSSVCTPLILTMMEKPGRYYLHVTWQDNTNASYRYIRFCDLELRAEPA